MKKYLKLFKMGVGELSRYLEYKVQSAGYRDLTHGRDFLYAPGEIPVLLVAHLDTVPKTPADIFYDRSAQVAWAPGGLGADDRAGVVAILELLREGFRPHILFTDGEESGGRGAKEASNAITPDVQYMVQLDRRGYNDAVFYTCDCERFENYVLSFGFKKEWGTFSDISILGPAWKMCGVNLSVGFYNEHRDTEHWVIQQTMDTVRKVGGMLKNIPKKPFEYKEKFSRWSGYLGSEDYDYGYGYGRRDGQVRYLHGNSFLTQAEYTKALAKDKEEKERELTFAATTDDSICVWVETSDLIDMYGGDPVFWVEFLRKYKSTIEDHLETELYVKVDECMYEGDARMTV